MADGSVGPGSTTTTSQDPVNADVCIDENWLLSFCVPDGIAGPETYLDLADRLTQMASATLRVALMRGDNQSDLPNTFSDAVHGAAVLLQLSSGVTAQARAIMEEPSHG